MFPSTDSRAASSLSAEPSEQLRVGSDGGYIVPSTPEKKAPGLGQMNAKEVADFLTYKVADDVAGLGRSFRFYDRDGSGEIDYDEFKYFLGHRCLTHLTPNRPI